MELSRRHVLGVGAVAASVAATGGRAIGAGRAVHAAAPAADTLGPARQAVARLLPDHSGQIRISELTDAGGASTGGNTGGSTGGDTGGSTGGDTGGDTGGADTGGDPGSADTGGDTGDSGTDTGGGDADGWVGGGSGDWFDDTSDEKGGGGSDRGRKAQGPRERFRVTGTAGAIEIAGTGPVAVLTGLHWYLKYTCAAHISWAGTQLDLPKTLPAPADTYEREATVPHRFALNDTHDGYTAPYADWPHWERFIDVLAVHGCNRVLVTVGSEAVYHRLLKDFGYSDAEARAWIPAPSHQPWWLLQNMAEYGGPISAGLLKRRTELAQRIVERMRELGMSPVLPGYFGTVPGDFAKRNPGGRTIPQGTWNGLPRPAWLDPRTKVFRKVADTFYRHQRTLFGEIGHVKMDLLHEGGDPGDVPVPEAARAVEDALHRSVRDATWVILGWQENPRREVLEGVSRKERMLIVDGLSDLERVTDREKDWGGVPYAFGTIPNFGGRTTLGAKTHMWTERFTQWRDRQGSALAGTAYMPEATHRDPAAFELFSELAWRREAVDRKAWFDDYARLRYGGDDSAARRALTALRDTAYEISSTDGRPHDSIFAARPSLEARSGTHFATHTPAFDLPDFDGALAGLLAVKQPLRGSDAYRYDLADAARQSLANRSWLLIGQLQSAYRAKDTAAFRKLATLWLKLMQLSEDITGTHRSFLLGPWLEAARNMAGSAAPGRAREEPMSAAMDAWAGAWTDGGGQATADDMAAAQERFAAAERAAASERAALERTARVLITTWADRPAADPGRLANYANRDWHGLIGDFHLPQWRAYLEELEEALKQDRAPKSFDWYALEEPWTKKTDTHALRPVGDTHRTAQRVHDALAKAPYQGSLTVTADPPALPAGGEGELKAVFRNENGLRATGAVDLALTGLAGAKPQDPTSVKRVGPGARATVRWRVPAPDRPLKRPLEPLPYKLTVEYGPEGESRVRTRHDGTLYVGGPLDRNLRTATSNDAVFGQLKDRFAINGAGKDLWKGTEEFGTVYREGALRDGDSVTAKVTSQEATGPWARAGLVARNTLAAPGGQRAADTSPGFVNLAVTPANGVALSYDSDGDGTLDTYKRVTGVKAPVTLRLSRKGNAFKGELSTDDGKTWREVATVKVPQVSDAMDAGLFMTATNGGSAARGQAEFSAWH
ncbi:alpha-N-acetylglucosaminidase [Streptomyces sp. NPDC054796]